MGILTSTYSTCILTPLPQSISLASALALLHNHDAMITMNPLVISHHLLPPSSASSSSSPPNSSSGAVVPTYTITDSLAPAPTTEPTAAPSFFSKLSAKLSPSTVTYTARMQNVPSGLKTEIEAPLGFRSFVEWTVRGHEGDDAGGGGGGRAAGGLELEEKATVVANRFLIGFATGTMEESHRELVGRFVTRLVGDLEDRRPQVPPK